MATRSDKIFIIRDETTEDLITFFPREQGDVGRDIASVKLALGEVYRAPIVNNSPEDNTIGEAWFDCSSNAEMSINSVLTFDKKLKKALMSFQIQHHLLILNYYLEKISVRNMDSESDLYLQIQGMIRLFDVEFGRINEATLAVLHGWRPGSFITNKSFFNEQDRTVEQIPMALYNFYTEGVITRLPDDILIDIYTESSSSTDWKRLRQDFNAVAASFRNWKLRLPKEKEAYAEYKSFSTRQDLKASSLFIAALEVLKFAHSLKEEEELTRQERERLVSRTFEPNYLLDPDPFIISDRTIGFFDRTDFTFRDLPDFDSSSNAEVIESLKESALEKVLQFYGRQKPEQIPLSLITFVEFRVPSLRPGDVYRSYFEISKSLLDELPLLVSQETTVEDVFITDETNTRLSEEEKQLADLYCADGTNLTEKESKAQFERYRSFASKQKLEISRRIRKAALDAQADSLAVDGVSLDLGVFGQANLSSSDIIDLATSVPGMAVDGIANLIERATESDAIEAAAKSMGADPGVLYISFRDLKAKVEEAAERFEKCEEDLKNFSIPDARFDVKTEAAQLREIIPAITDAIKKDKTFFDGTVTPSGKSLETIINDPEFKLIITFKDTPQGSIIMLMDEVPPPGLPAGGIPQAIFKPAATGDRSVAYAVAVDAEGTAQKQEGVIAGPLLRERSVHYLRFINQLSSTEFGSLIAHELLGGTCDDPDENQRGRIGSFILKYTKFSKGKWSRNKEEDVIAFHSSKKNNFADKREKAPKKPDSKWFETGNLEEVGAFGFEKDLKVLGPNCFEDEEARKELLETVLNTVSIKRLMCEYAACLGVPSFELKLPDINLDALEFPEFPAIKIPGGDYWKDLGKLIVEIFERAVCTLIKNIFDILQSPFCAEKFAEDLYGRASDTSPEIKRALAEGFTDTGIPRAKTDKAKEFIDAIMNLLTPNELCALLNGEILNAEVYHIIRGIAENLELSQELETEEQITNFFATIGFFAGPEVCDNLSRYDLKDVECSDVYSILQQIRSAILKGEDVSIEKIKEASAAAEKNYQDKAAALNFLAGNGGLEDLMPELSATAPNSVFATAPEFMKKSANTAARGYFDLPKLSLVNSLNSYVESFYVETTGIARPEDESYDSEANLVVQRAASNLRNFTNFDLDPNNINLASPETTILFRKALLILCDDYVKQEYDNGISPSFQVYTPTELDPDQPTAESFLAGSLVGSDEYDLFDDAKPEAIKDQYSRLYILAPIWQKMFPINLGDVAGSTRTISSYKDWTSDVVRAVGTSVNDTRTINTNYLNKINQVLKALQDEVTSNAERAFRPKKDSEFLGVLKSFYDIESESFRPLNTDNPDVTPELITVDVEGINLKTALKHPVFDEEQVSIKTTESYIKRNNKDFVLRDTTLHDDFFFGTPTNQSNNNAVGEVFTVCEEVPEQYQGLSETADNRRVETYQQFMKSVIGERTRYYSNQGVSYDDVASSIPTNLSWSRWWKDSFVETYEGITEQMISFIRESRIFKDPQYLTRLDLKLRSAFYYDPSTECFKNPNSLLKYGSINFDELVSNRFGIEYTMEYAKPENSIIYSDPSKPGAFEKAMMNTSLVGYIKMCLVELLLKGGICYSVWDLDFVRGDKLFREYVFRFIKKQIENEPFFSQNLIELDDTIVRVSEINNKESALKKLIYTELDGVIKDMSKSIFENGGLQNYNNWFLDMIPLVGVPNEKHDGTWISRLDEKEIFKFRKNNFVFLEEYVRVNGPLRSFNSNRRQIAQAQAERLDFVYPGLVAAATNSNLEIPNRSEYDIENQYSVDLDLYEDDDEFPNEEVLAIEDFSKVIRSLLENNKELNRFFCDMTRRIYDPENENIHNLPQTLLDKTPTKAITRTFKRYEFKNKNIFSALFKASELHNDDPSDRANTIINASDKFRTYKNVTRQSKDSYFVNELLTGERNSDYEQPTEQNIVDLLLQSLSHVDGYDTDYHILHSTLAGVLGNTDEFYQLKSRDDGKISIYDEFNQMLEDIPVRPEDEIVRNQPREYLFKNDLGPVDKDAYDNVVESNPDLVQEHWEHTIIDLVGDGSPIFNQPGESNWNPVFGQTHEQRTQVAELLDKVMKFTHATDYSGGGGSIHPGTPYEGYLVENGHIRLEQLALINAHAAAVQGHEDDFVFITTATGIDAEAGDDAYSEKVIQTARVSKPMGHIKTDTWTSRDNGQGTMGHTRQIQHTYATNNVTIERMAGRADNESYEVSKDYELLGLNDYKVPLRILITQIKDKDGKVLKVFARHIIPEFMNFADFPEGPELTRRGDLLTRAITKCLYGFQDFNVKATQKIMAEAKVSRRDFFEQYKHVLSNAADPENSPIRYKSNVFDLIQESTGHNTDGSRRGVPVPFRYPGDRNAPLTTDNHTTTAHAGDRSSLPSFCSVSKFYSIAAQLEAEEKQTKNFKTNESNIKDQFNDLGSLVRNPRKDMITNFNSFRNHFYGLPAVSGQSIIPGRSLDTSVRKSERQLRDDKDIQPIFRELYTHAQLQNHSLYSDSLQSMLDSIFVSGLQQVSTVENPGTRVLKSIGSLVSWYGQRRRDSFWGRTSSPSHLSNPPETDEEKFLYEAPFFSCGPSLFYGDGRASIMTYFASKLEAIKDRSPEDRSRARSVIEAQVMTYVNRNSGLFANIDKMSATYGVPATLANGYLYTLYSSVAGKKDNMKKLVQTFGCDMTSEGYAGVTDSICETTWENAGQSNIFLPNFNKDFIIQDNEGNPIRDSTISHIGFFTRDELRRLGMLFFDSETRPNLASDTLREVLRTELLAWRAHLNYSSNSYEKVIASMSAAYDAALEQLGISILIRDVNSSYVRGLSNTEDQNIISDILQDSDIKYGIRICNAFGKQKQSTVRKLIEKAWTESTIASEEERSGKLVIPVEGLRVSMEDFYSLPLASYEQSLPNLGCYQAYSPAAFRQKTLEQLPHMKNQLIKDQKYKDFFEFIVPSKNIASSITIHSTSMLAGFGDMPFVLSSVKSSLASIFAMNAKTDESGEYGITFDGAEFSARYGMLGMAGGQNPECFDFPDMGEWWKIIREMIIQYLKYFPSVILRGIADGIDPAYKEMKRHYLACELPDLTNRSWGASSGYGEIPLGLRGSERMNKSYSPLIPAFPVDLAKGIGRLPNPRYLVRSIDKLIAYILGGPQPLLDPTYAFKIPCLKIDQESPNSWQRFDIGTHGRYGHPLTPLTALALLTYELPADRDLRSNICTDIEGNRIPCPDEIE